MVLTVNISIILIGLIVAGLNCAKELKKDDPKLTRLVAVWGFILSIMVGIGNGSILVYNHFHKPPETAKEETLVALAKEVLQLKQQLTLPTVEEVESELDKELRMAMEEKKNQALSEYKKGLAAYDNYQFKKAISHFQNAINIVELSSFHLSIGNIKLIQGELDKAEDHYNKSLKLARMSKNEETLSAVFGKLETI